MCEVPLCDTITFAYIMYPFVIIGIWALRLCTIERKRKVIEYLFNAYNSRRMS